MSGAEAPLATSPQPVGVLVMAYGTPSSPEEIESFYTDVRRGRPPEPGQLAELERRYRAIGGTSQLAARTAEQVAGIEAALAAIGDRPYACRYGAKHSRPKIEEAVEELASLGARSLTGIVLAPHYSKGSVGEYLERAGARAAELGLPAAFVEDWHDDESLVSLLGERVVDSLGELGAVPGTDAVEVLFTAHSLPLRIIESGDGYDARLADTARLVAGAVGLERWRTCWQSAGRTPEPWIGPDLLSVLRALPSEGVEAVVVCPAGFTSDHLEVNYDLDVEARRVALEVGLGFARTASLNAEPRLCAALARLVAARAREVALPL